MKRFYSIKVEERKKQKYPLSLSLKKKLHSFATMNNKFLNAVSYNQPIFYRTNSLVPDRIFCFIYKNTFLPMTR